MLEVRGLRRRFGAVDALRDVGLTLRRGEMLGFLGPNGAAGAEILLAIALSAAVAGRIYRNSILRTGKRVRIIAALRGA